MRKTVTVGVVARRGTHPRGTTAGAVIYGSRTGTGIPRGRVLAPVPYSDGTWADMLRDADLADRLPDRGALRPGRHPGRGHVRLAYDAPTGTAYWGTWHADPTYTQAQSDPHDVAVVVLDKPVTGITPAGCRRRDR